MTKTYRALLAQLAVDPDNDELRSRADRLWRSESLRYQPLLQQVCHQYCRSGSIDYGDYYSAALRGLERALRTTIVTPLPPGYARTCVRNAVIDYHRKRSREIRREILDESL